MAHPKDTDMIKYQDDDTYEIQTDKMENGEEVECADKSLKFKKLSEDEIEVTVLKGKIKEVRH